jgi:hypothetical protein
MQQMQEMSAQVMQRMQEKGIDMQQFAQDMMQQMQGGSFDPEAFQQKLIDQGILDAGMLTRMKSTLQGATLAGIRRQLNSTDEEWAVLLPKLQKVVAAMSEAGVLTQGRSAGMGGAAMMMGQASPEMSRAVQKLRAMLQDKDSPPGAVATCLAEYRALRNKAAATLTASREDLRGVLTLRQEAVLMNMQILE